ncbi:glutathione S-transferase [Ferrovibrio terrae]|uniref:glutathione S-transferase n=1 Tax=Ferrovibrio terrae TaxID=2594003 RepID=UPI003137A0B7
MTLRLHRFALSGHAHRAELLLNLLGLRAELIDVDLGGGEHKQPAFLAKNAFGQVPVLEDGDTVIADSNAILVYLASRYDEQRRWLPVDPVQAAQVQRWLSVAAGQLASGPAAARMVTLFKAPFDHDRAKTVATALFAVLEQHLAQQTFLVGAAPTIADLALYSYTAHAPEGGVSLQPYPQIRAWLGRIEALPGFVPMPKTAVAA